SFRSRRSTRQSTSCAAAWPAACWSTCIELKGAPGLHDSSAPLRRRSPWRNALPGRIFRTAVRRVARISQALSDVARFQLSLQWHEDYLTIREDPLFDKGTYLLPTDKRGRNEAIREFLDRSIKIETSLNSHLRRL